METSSACTQGITSLRLVPRHRLRSCSALGETASHVLAHVGRSIREPRPELLRGSSGLPASSVTLRRPIGNRHSHEWRFFRCPATAETNVTAK